MNENNSESVSRNGTGNGNWNMQWELEKKYSNHIAGVVVGSRMTMYEQMRMGITAIFGKKIYGLE